MKRRDPKAKPAPPPADPRFARPASTPENSPGIPLWWWAVLYLGLFIAYAPALNGPFLFDDLALPPMNEGARVSNAQYFTAFRPLFYMTLNWEQRIFGANPFPYHLFNLLYHAVNGLLIYQLLRQLLETRLEKRPAALVSFLCAALFLLHPLQAESVAYIASRSEVMSVLFSWTALLVYMGSRELAPTGARALVVFLLLGLGVLSKETVVGVPAAFLLVDFFFRPGVSFAGVRKRILFYLPFLIGLILVSQRILSRFSDTTIGTATGITNAQYLATQCQVIWIYFRLLLLPFGQNIDWAIPPVKSIANPLSILGGLGLLTLVASAWIFRRKYPFAACGVLMFLALLSPTSSVIPIADMLAERRVYLPFLGVLLIVAEILMRVPLNSRKLLASAAVLTVLLTLTFRRAALFGNPLAMWEDSVRANPANGRAHFQRAFALYEAGFCQPAVEGFTKAAALQKADYRLYIDWGLALDCAGRPAEAVEKVTEALKLEDNYHGWATAGMLYGKQGKTEPALTALARAEKLKPDYDMTHFYRGNVYLTSKQPEQAIEAFQTALRHNPGNRAAREGLAAAQRALQR